MVALSVRTFIERVRPYRLLLVDALIAFVLMWSSYDVYTPGEITYAPPWQFLPGYNIAFAGWCIAAFVLLSLTRTRPEWTCWGLPILLVIHLVFFLVTSPAVVVTFYAMLILGRFAVPRWRRTAWLAALTGTALAVVFRSVLMTELPILAGVTVTSWLVMGFFWQWGSRMRDRDLEMKALRDRASLAAISERTRIAREMHDIVAHSLTAIIVQADGGRYAGKKDPDMAVATLETIASTARESLDQMRGLLSVLRGADDNDDQRQSTPGVDAVPQLILEARANGLDIDYQTQGEPYHLDATRELTVYRIVQECLTNVIRHGGTENAAVEIIWGVREVVVMVHNDVVSDHGKTWTGGSGRGLTGIRERAELHGGRIEIDTHGGFTVTARIPRK